jgi:hypothetical protein
MSPASAHDPLQSRSTAAARAADAPPPPPDVGAGEQRALMPAPRESERWVSDCQLMVFGALGAIHNNNPTPPTGARLVDRRRWSLPNDPVSERPKAVLMMVHANHVGARQHWIETST